MNGSSFAWIGMAIYALSGCSMEQEIDIVEKRAVVADIQATGDHTSPSEDSQASKDTVTSQQQTFSKSEPPPNLISFAESSVAVAKVVDFQRSLPAVILLNYDQYKALMQQVFQTELPPAPQDIASSIGRLSMTSLQNNVDVSPKYLRGIRAYAAQICQDQLNKHPDLVSDSGVLHSNEKTQNLASRLWAIQKPETTVYTKELNRLLAQNSEDQMKKNAAYLAYCIALASDIRSLTR